MTEPLSKIDSAVQGLSPDSPKAVKGNRRQSSAAASGVFNIKDLGTWLSLSPGTAITLAT